MPELLAPPPIRYHSESMRNVLVRGVPDAVHEALHERAARNGQSLQQFLVLELTRLAERPTRDEVLDRIERRRGGFRLTGREVVEDIHAERAERDARW